jgi:outer membrane biosynthesis protein TonB
MSNVVKISKATATAVFVELGFKSATGWDAERLNAKLAKLGDHVDGTEELADPAAAKGLKTILAAFKAGSTVQVSDEEGATEEPAAKPAKAKAPKAEPAPEPAAKPAKGAKPAKVAAEDAEPAAEPAKGKGKPAAKEPAPAAKPAKAKAKSAPDADEDDGDEGVAKDPALPRLTAT